MAAGAALAIGKATREAGREAMAGGGAEPGIGSAGAALAIGKATREAGREAMAGAAADRALDPAEPIPFYSGFILFKFLLDFLHIVGFGVDGQPVHLD